MERIMLQVYVKDSKRAAELYSKAFKAELKNIFRNQDGSYVHAEIDLHNCVLSLSELEDEIVVGNNMQFCIQFGDNEDLLNNAYKVLSPGSEVLHPLGKCFYSSLMVDLIDKFGVRWCFFK